VTDQAHGSAYRAEIRFVQVDPRNAFFCGPVTVRRLNELMNLVAI